MTEFNRVQAEIAELAADIDRVEGKADPLQKRQATFRRVQDTLGSERLRQQLAKFSKRLTEKDPVTDQLRYGEAMRGKVSALQSQFDMLLQRVDGMAVGMSAEVFEQQEQQKLDEQGREALQRQLLQAQEERRRQDAAEAKLQGQQALEQAAAAEAEARRLAAEAAAHREEKRRQAEEELTRQQEDKARREREALELQSSVTLGPAGVQHGLRMLTHACGGDARKRSAILKAVREVVQNVARDPSDARFKKIRRGNPAFHQAIGQYDGAVQILLAAGFKLQVEEGQTMLVIEEVDPVEDMDAWTQWYEALKSAVGILQQEA